MPRARFPVESTVEPAGGGDALSQAAQDRGHRENELHGRRGLPWSIHLAAILVLALAATIRFFPVVTSAGARTDERVYLHAFRAVSSGESPYSAATADGLRFYYPPAFAVLGAAALDTFDSRTVVIALRSANGLGLASCLWISLLFAPLRWQWCLAAAVLYIALGPAALHHGLRSGNLSLAVVGSSLLGLAAWRQRPFIAGLLLGASTIVKPVAPIALSTLATHRPTLGGRKHLLAAVTGLALGTAALFASPWWTEYLALDGDVGAWPLRRSISLYRWLHLMGLEVSPIVLVLVVALAAAGLARRSPISPRQFLILAIVGMMLATPALWSHTMLLALPLQIMALARAWARLRSRQPSASRRARYELALVILAVAALQFSDGIGGGLEVAPVLFQLPALAVPIWAPACLAMYVWREPSAVEGAT